MISGSYAYYWQYEKDNNSCLCMANTVVAYQELTPTTENEVNIFN